MPQKHRLKEYSALFWVKYFQNSRFASLLFFPKFSLLFNNRKFILREKQLGSERVTKYHSRWNASRFIRLIHTLVFLTKIVLIYLFALLSDTYQGVTNLINYLLFPSSVFCARAFTSAWSLYWNVITVCMLHLDIMQTDSLERVSLVCNKSLSQ